MASQLIELMAGTVTEVSNNIVKIEIESELGYPLPLPQRAIFELYVPGDELKVGQYVTQYLSTEIPDPQPRAWTPKAAALLLLDKLRREKPGDRSDSDRRYAIAITEAEKLAAYIMTYLSGE